MNCQEKLLSNSADINKVPFIRLQFLGLYNYIIIITVWFTTRRYLGGDVLLDRGIPFCA